MKKILVIEDEAAIRESIVELLEAENFKAMGAEDGKAGVQVAQDYLPDMILCDVMMPELDGYGVLHSLRQNPATATIPFIFLTARVSKTDFRQGMELGADDYLTKPCTASELLSAINSRFEKQEKLQYQSHKQLDSLRSSIALSLPHELRTPLNAILGLSELLIDDYEQIERSEILELSTGIHSAASRLYRLIQNFLLYADLEMIAQDPTRQQTLNKGEIAFPKVLITDTSVRVAGAAGREADLKVDLENALIQISELKLEKIIEELVDNACKFSSAGSPITLTGRITEQDYILSITDRGRGMTSEQMASLGAYMQFERKFYEQQGSGLGLAIARRLVEIHGGSMTIESTPGQQTTIQVTFPIVQE